MLLAIMIITALVVSAFITGTIKHNLYKNIPDEDVNSDEIKADLFFTAFGVIIISNLVPFILGAVIGIYAIL
jgi:hypothetical protein